MVSTYKIKHPKTWTTSVSLKQEFLWGYDTPLDGDKLLQDTVPLDDFINIITDPTINPSSSGTIKNILIYWSRGDVLNGDEAKMIDMKIDAYDKRAHCAGHY